MERVLVNTAAQISETFYQGGAPADPGTVAVVVTSDDGTQVASGNASGTGTGARSFTLTATNTSKLDRLTMTWTSASLGTITTTVEIVGGYLFTVAEARTLRPLDNVTQYPVAAIQAMRIRVEQTLEDACGIAFVPRYTRATLSGLGTSPLRLPKAYVRRIRWATVAGAALTTADLANLSYDLTGQVYGYSWPIGYGNVIAGVEHGMDQPPERVRGAALLLAKQWLISGPVDDRAATFSSDATGATYSMVIPGRNGSWVGVPEVDAVIDQYRLPTIA